MQPGFVLCVSRLLTYKNVDAVVAAFGSLPHLRLVVVGEGPERERLAAASPSNVTIAGRVSEAELRWLYASCFGLVSAAYEDFGLTPIEAAAFGKPAAVLRAGGFLDTVLPGRTGVFFAEPSPDSIAEAVARLLAGRWERSALVRHAASYDEARFIIALRAAVLSSPPVDGLAGSVEHRGEATPRDASPPRLFGDR